MDIPSDARIIARSSREPAAFAKIYDRHASTLQSYLRRRVGYDDAEDLLSETFLIALGSRDRYDRSRSSALPWLYGIAANLVLKRHRTLGRQQRAVDRLMMIAPTTAEFEDRLVDDNANAQMLRRLESAIRALSPQDAEVLVLYAWQQLSYSDIALAMDIPVGTVRSRLNRVRSVLREPESEIGQVPTIHCDQAPGGAIS